MADVSALITAISTLLTAIAWPTVVVVVAYLFRKPLGTLLGSEDLSFTGPGGLALTAKRKATDALLDASKSKGEEELTREEAAAEVSVSQRRLKKVSRPVVLWVDDRPSNNTYERQAMEALGIRFVLSGSTDDALSKLQQGRFDVVISDMGRPGDDRAGYTLLDRLRQEGDETPYVIYAGSRSPEHFDESVRHGAVGCTNRAKELISMVTGALNMAAAGVPA